jgi:hypothetical protein
MLFLVKEGIEEMHSTEIKETIQKEFVSGHNIYIFDLLEFACVLLALLGEQGRREFLLSTGEILERFASPFQTRREWADLLGRV